MSMRPNFYPKSIFSFLFYFLITLLIGTQTGNAQTTPATALSFNPSLTVGDNSRLNYVSVANPYSAFQKEITVEFWMNPATAYLPFGSVMGQSNNNSSDNFSGGEVWLMHPNTDGTMTFFVNDGGTLRGTTCNIIANSWHHYAAVASASSTKFYVDGVLVHTGPGVSGTIPFNPSSVIHMGKDVRFATMYAVNGDPQNRYATMALDEVRIWSRALCADEINFNKNAEINPTGQNGLQEYYRFNQGFVGANNASITNLIDFSGNNRNGVLNNFTLNGATSNWSASGATKTGIVNAFVQQTATISGNTSICAGSTTILTSSLSGGKWSSSNTAVATINETTGVVTAISAGTTTITYTTECAQGSISFTVKALPNSTISAGGATTICPGSFVTLSAVTAPGNTYQWFNNGNSINGASNATYNAANSGAYTVRVTNNGCVSTSAASISINAVDVTLPVINGSPTITTPVNANGAVVANSENGAVVNFNLPTATDNCTQNVSVVAVPASGSVFPLGTSEVNITATDASGNSVQSKFYIKVTGRAPSIVVPANIISCDPVVNFTATDNVGIPASTINYSIAPGSTFPFGTTTVTATATNEFGTSTNTFTVTVNKPVADVVINGATTFCDGGNVTFNAGQYGLQFTGTQHVNVVNGFAATDDITIEATIKPAVIADGSFRVIMNHNSWYTGTVHFQFAPDGRLQFAINSAAPEDQYAAYNFIPNTTYRIAAVYSKSGKYVKFYVNGVLINTATYSSTVSVVGNAGYRIGSWDGSSRFFKGTIDDLKIWNVQRTNAEVLADGSALPIPSGTPNLVRYYKFNEGAGTTTADAAGNGNGTLVNNPVWVTTAQAGQSYLWSNGAITPSIAATATGSYSVTVTDAAGCTTTSTPIAVTVNKAPVFTVCAPNQTVDNASGLNSAVVTYTATATGTPSANLTYTLSGATTGSGTGTGSGSSFNIGTTTVTITATNSCGSTTCTFTVKVNDATPPTINTIPDINAVATSASGAVVTYTSPVGADNMPGATTIQTSGLASGAVFPIGTTINTFVVTDAAGLTATSTFKVIVAGVAPSIVVPSTITVNAPANACSAAVNFAATETTAIPASTITYTVNGQPVVSGAIFPVGTTTVTATATNAVGSSTATFDIVVKDVTAPTIAASANLNAIATSAAGAVVTYTLPTATDNCTGNVTVVASPASGSTFAIGTTNVTITATDAAGNASTSTFDITVVGVAPSIVVPSTIGVDASTTNCGAAVNFAATETTGIPASTITYTVNGQPVISGASFPLGITTVTATATNAVGASSATFDIVVTDNTAPVINTPAAQVFCENTAGTYSLQAVSASDNCGIATVSFAITGATTRTGSGYNAGTAFNVGTSTIAYTVTDLNGNISTKTLVVTVNKAPKATISTSNPDAFCNKLTVIGNSNSPITGYVWTYNGNAFAGTQAISLDNTNGDGTYSLLVTDNKGCTSLAAVTYQYSKQNTISNYTILAYKEAELKEYNTVQTGSVGVMSKKGEAEIGKNSSVAAPGAFVKAPKMEVKQGANVPVRLVGVASVSLPTMQYNSANTSSLPNYTTNAGATISLSGNYKNLKIRKGSNVILSGTTFGNIDIEEGSVVRFTSTIINVEHLKVGKGPNNGLTQVRFANNTSVRVSKHVQIEEDCFINPDANQVTFYLGRQSNHDCNKHKNKYGNGHDKDRDDDDDDDHDRGHGDGDQKFEVKGGNTTVIANVYAPTGDIKVKGGEGCHKNHSNTTVRMTGLFIGYEVEGDGRNIIWNNYACGSPSPLISTDVLPVFNKTAEPQELADDLKVTVMPNPSTTYFTLKLASKSELPVNIKVVDAAGRIVDVKAKQPANSTMQIGHSYATGSYFAEFIQGNQRKVVQLIKLK